MTHTSGPVRPRSSLYSLARPLPLSESAGHVGHFLATTSPENAACDGRPRSALAVDDKRSGGNVCETPLKLSQRNVRRARDVAFLELAPASNIQDRCFAVVLRRGDCDLLRRFNRDALRSELTQRQR